MAAGFAAAVLVALSLVGLCQFGEGGAAHEPQSNAGAPPGHRGLYRMAESPLPPFRSPTFQGEPLPLSLANALSIRRRALAEGRFSPFLTIRT